MAPAQSSKSGPWRPLLLPTSSPIPAPLSPSSFVLSSLPSFSSNRALAPPTSFKQQIFSSLLRLAPSWRPARAPARPPAQADRRGPHRRSRTFVRSRRPTKEGRRGGGEGAAKKREERRRKEGGGRRGEERRRAIEAVGEDLGAPATSWLGGRRGGGDAEDGRPTTEDE